MVTYYMKDVSPNSEHVLPYEFWSHTTGMTINERFTDIRELVEIDTDQHKMENDLVDGWLKKGGAKYAEIMLAVLNDTPIYWGGGCFAVFKRIVKQRFANGKGVHDLLKMVNSERQQLGQSQLGRPQLSNVGRGGFNNAGVKTRAQRARPYRGRGIGRGSGVHKTLIRHEVQPGPQKNISFRRSTMMKGRGGIKRGGLMRQAGGTQNAQQIREQLDRELDAYMAKSRAALDRQLDEYMAAAYLI